MAQDDIQGQVVDAQGNPVDGAIVELTKSYQSSPLDEQVVRRTTTDANGNYIFEFHPDGDGTTQEWHVSCYNHDGSAYVNSFNNPGVTADLPSNTIPDSELNHRYPTDEGTGDTVSDSIGNQDFSINGASWVTGQGGRGDAYLSYDGVNDKVENTDGSAWDSDNFTWLIWFNPDNLTNRQVILATSISNANSANYLLEIDDNGHLRLFINNADGGANVDVSGDVLSANTWNFAAISGDNGNSATLYHASANDASVSTVGTQNYDQGLSGPTSRMTYGVFWLEPNGSGIRYFNGGVDNPASNIGTALSQSTIEEFFIATKDDY